MGKMQHIVSSTKDRYYTLTRVIRPGIKGLETDTNDRYVVNEPLYHEQDVTQGQFLSGVYLV